MSSILNSQNSQQLQQKAEIDLKSWLVKVYCNSYGSNNAPRLFNDVVLAIRALCEGRLTAEESIANISDILSNEDPVVTSRLLEEFTEILDTVSAAATERMKICNDVGNNSALPTQITHSATSKISNSDLTKNVRFLERFKARQPDEFPLFLNLLAEYERGYKDALTVIREVDALLPNDRELFREFQALVNVIDTTVDSAPSSVKCGSGFPVDDSNAVAVVRASSEPKQVSVENCSIPTSTAILATTTTGEDLTTNVLSHPTDSRTVKDMVVQDGDRVEPSQSNGKSSREALDPEGRSLEHISLDAGRSVIEHLKMQAPLLSGEIDEAVKLFQKIAIEMGCQETFLSFIKQLALYLYGCLSLSEFLLVVEPIFPMHVPNLPRQLKQFLLSRESSRRRVSQFIIPLSELDFNGCQREGKSYLKLPDSFKRLWCEGREYEAQEILDQLNDDFVSIPHGSEEDAYRHVKRNPNEEMMFHLEDEMFELDVMIAGLEAVMKKLEPIEKEILQMTLQQKYEYKLRQQIFSVRHLKSLALVYGQHGSEILELLRRSPGLTIGPLLSRIRVKLEEWREARTRLIEGPWNQIATKNFYRQFEHQSHYLKALDRFLFTPSALVNQAVVQYCILRNESIPPEVARKSKHILRQICNNCGGFPGCPNIPKDVPSMNGNDVKPTTINAETSSVIPTLAVSSDTVNSSFKSDNSKSIECVMSTLNVHLDYPFGVTDDSTPNHRCSSLRPPEFEFSNMTDPEIHHNLLQLLATAGRHCYGKHLSSGSIATLQRLKRFLILILRGLFRIPSDCSIEHLESLDSLNISNGSSDVYHRDLTTDSETTPELLPRQNDDLAISDATSASDTEPTSTQGQTMEEDSKVLDPRTPHLRVKSTEKQRRKHHTSNRSKQSSHQLASFELTTLVDDDEGLKDLQADPKWRQILTARHVTKTGDVLHEWKTIVKQFFDSDFGIESYYGLGSWNSGNKKQSISDHGDLKSPCNNDNNYSITLFANDGLYIVARCYCQLYERLARIKLLISQRKDPQHPSSSILWGIDDGGIEQRMSYSDFFNSIILKVGMAEIPQEIFEEELRISAGNDSVFLLTLPILLSTLSNFWSNLLSNLHLQRLSALFLAYYSKSTLIPDCAIREYEVGARSICGPQSLFFRIDFDAVVGHCSIRTFTPSDYDLFLSSLPNQPQSLADETFCSPQCRSRATFRLRMKESRLAEPFYLCHSIHRDLLRIAFGRHIVRVGIDKDSPTPAPKSLESVGQKPPHKPAPLCDSKLKDVAVSEPEVSGSSNSRKHPRKTRRTPLLENEVPLTGTSILEEEKTPQQPRKSRRLLRSNTLETGSITGTPTREKELEGRDSDQSLNTPSVPHTTITTRSSRRLTRSG